MIFCDEWFHPASVDLEEGEVNDVGRWHCPPCTDVMAQNPSLSRKGIENGVILLLLTFGHINIILTVYCNDLIDLTVNMLGYFQSAVTIIFVK